MSMGLQLRFIEFNYPKRDGSRQNPISHWKKYYTPPWKLIFSLIQVFLILWIYFSVLNPTFVTIYQIRDMFSSILLPESDDSTAFFSIDSIHDAIDNCLTNLERIYKDSFQDFYFSNQTNPVVFTFYWLNGTITETLSIDISSDLFVHIKSFDISSKFMLTIDDSDVIGCTQWTFVFNIKAGLGDYLFYFEPQLYRSWCPETIVGNSPKERIAFTSSETMAMPHFDRTSLPFQSYIMKFGAFLFCISTLDLFSILKSLSRSFLLHRKLMQTNPSYGDLTPYEQYHSTIGFWRILNLITVIFLLITSCMFLYDSFSFTQFVSRETQMVYGFSSFLCILCLVQWLHFIPSCYCIVLIIRQAFGTILLIMIGILPIVLALAFVVIFLFGYVSELTKSMVVLLETILSVTFGDMISDFYLAFTDGSEIYNDLAFVFVTICTAISMWLFFTSFTAQVASIYLNNVSHIIGENEEENQ